MPRTAKKLSPPVSTLAAQPARPFALTVVSNINAKSQREMVDSTRDLLEEIQRGEVTGLVIMTRNKTGGHSCSVLAHYDRNPHEAAAAGARLQQLLLDRAIVQPD